MYTVPPVTDSADDWLAAMRRSAKFTDADVDYYSFRKHIYCTYTLSFAAEFSLLLISTLTSNSSAKFGQKSKRASERFLPARRYA